MPMPDWAKLKDRPDRPAGAELLQRAQGEATRRWTRSRRNCWTPTTSWACRWQRAKLTGVAVDAVFDSVSVGTTFKAEARRKGVVFCSISKPSRNTPTWCGKYLGKVVPVADNYFARSTRAVFSDGSFVFIPRACAARWSCPPISRINASHTGQFERTLIVCEEGAYVSLPRGLHRADARREPAARGGGRAGRAGRCRDQIQHGAELVPGRRGRGRRHLQLRDQARGSAAARFKVTWTQVGTGSAITWKYPSCVLLGDDSVGEFHSGGADPPPPAGRHRHQDGPRRQAHKSKIVSRASAPATARTAIAGW